LNQFDALQGPSGQSWIIDVGPDATDVVGVADGTEDLASMPPELVDPAAQWLGGPPPYRLALTIGDSPACTDLAWRIAEEFARWWPAVWSNHDSTEPAAPWGRGGRASQSAPARTPWPRSFRVRQSLTPLRLLELYELRDSRFRSCSNVGPAAAGPRLVLSMSLSQGISGEGRGGGGTRGRRCPGTSAVLRLVHVWSRACAEGATGPARSVLNTSPPMQHRLLGARSADWVATGGPRCRAPARSSSACSSTTRGGSLRTGRDGRVSGRRPVSRRTVRRGGRGSGRSARSG